MKFIGLQRLVGMCEESNITSIKRLNRGEVVVRGLFEAAEDLQLNASKVMSLKQNSTAFKLAFAPNFSGPRKPTSIVDGEVDASGPELGGTALSGKGLTRHLWMELKQLLVTQRIASRSMQTLVVICGSFSSNRSRRHGPAGSYGKNSTYSEGV